MKLCRRCGVPISGPGRSKWCPTCGPVAKVESTARWAQSEKGKARKRAYKNSPRGKIVAALWQDRNRERIRKWARGRYRLRPRPAIPCASEGCDGVFVRGPGDGHRKFCHGCSRFYYPWETTGRRRRAA